MKKETILKKAIEKAVKNGWKFGKGYLKNDSYKNFSGDDYIKVILFDTGFAKAFWGEEKRYIESLYCSNKCEVIFNPFAKPKFCYKCGAKIIKKREQRINRIWQDELQIMVLKEDKIKYLEQFL